jgi:hypothetical protein
MKNKKILFKYNDFIYYTIKDTRTCYYKAKLNNKRVTKQTRISKEKFYNDILRLKKSSK